MNAKTIFTRTFHATLNPGESLTLIASTEANPDLNGEIELESRRTYEQKLIEARSAGRCEEVDGTPDWISHLMLTADQFVVTLPLPGEPDGKSIIAGYHWFADWGRDTMISLPGLTISTVRPEVARSILRIYSQYVNQGMLPNRFPDAGEPPEYNTVDATLWYFEAIHIYHNSTGDHALIRELFPVLTEIIDWHFLGTRYNIHVDKRDGLLYAGEKHG